MVSHELKTVFVRIHKTASSPMIKALSQYGGRYSFKRDISLWHLDPLHLPLWFMKEQLTPVQYETYFKFGFVRNPWETLVSEFHYIHQWWARQRPQRKRLGEKEWAERYDIVKRLAAKDFDTYIRNHHKVLFKPSPYPKYCVLDMLEGCDFIGKFENLQEDWQIVCKKIGLPTEPLPHTNVTEHKHYSTFYTDELAEIVGDRYMQVTDRFGYEFERV